MSGVCPCLFTSRWQYLILKVVLKDPASQLISVNPKAVYYEKVVYNGNVTICNEEVDGKTS